MHEVMVEEVSLKRQAQYISDATKYDKHFLATQICDIYWILTMAQMMLQHVGTQMRCKHSQLPNGIYIFYSSTLYLVGLLSWQQFSYLCFEVKPGFARDVF